MKKSIRHIIWAVPFLLLGCEPNPLIVDDVPEADAKIVVSSAFIPEQNIALVLTQNFSALDQDVEANPDLIDDILVSDAEVLITVGNDIYPLTEEQPGLYVNQDLPYFQDTQYKLSVRDRRNDRVISSTTTMLPAVSFDEIRIEPYILSTDTFPWVKYSFTDPPEDNWYMINVQYFERPTDSVNSFLDVRVYNHLVTDENMNGGQITDEVVAFVGREVQPGDSIIVSLTNITQDYYNFLEKRRNRFFALDLVSEPFNLPTNINNGYGFFNIHEPDIRLIQVE